MIDLSIKPSGPGDIFWCSFKRNDWISLIVIVKWVKSLSHVQLFATPWTVAYQAPLSMGFSRQEYWSGLPFPSPGDLPNPGIEPEFPAFQADALTSEPPGKHKGEAISVGVCLTLSKYQHAEGEREHEVTQSYLTLCDPMVCSLPGSSAHGIFKARILEWVAISFSRRSSWLRDWTWISCIVGRRFTGWATRRF